MYTLLLTMNQTVTLRERERERERERLNGERRKEERNHKQYSDRQSVTM